MNPGDSDSYETQKNHDPKYLDSFEFEFEFGFDTESTAAWLVPEMLC